jgi:hypothetical protein
MIENTVKKLYEFLLNQEYQHVELLTAGVRLNAKEIEESIKGYGRKLAPYPEKVEIDAIEIFGTEEKAWSVVAPVYTMEEGFSDLSIELTLIEKSEDYIKVELDNIHVR